MSLLETRKTTTIDFDFIYKLHCQTFHSYVEQTWGWKEEVQFNGMREEFDDSLFEIICNHGEDVGVISVIEQEKALFLKYIAILPTHHKQGFGTELLRKVLEQATHRGFSVRLNVLRVNRAKAFYERLGFEIVGGDKDKYFMEWRTS